VIHVIRSTRRGLQLSAAGALLALTATACGGGDLGGASDASSYPDDDIRMIIGLAPGGPTDLSGRAIARFFEKDMGVTVAVENIEGATGAVGLGEVARAKPDGLTIGLTTASTMRAPLIEDVGFTDDDLSIVGIGASGPGVLVVPANSPYQDAESLFAAAKANPGKISIGTSGASGAPHVELAYMQSEYDYEFRLVPFEGEAPSVTAALGNNVDAVFGSNGETLMGQVTSGGLRAIAVASPEPLDYLPGVPTFTELGYPKLTHAVSQFLVVAPAGIDPAVLSKLEDELEKALEDPETQDAIGEERLPDGFHGSKESTELIEQEEAELKPVYEQLFG
jgi:tripartite-type tricarboxylate transporter receptor subunit TctC